MSGIGGGQDPDATGVSTDADEAVEAAIAAERADQGEVIQPSQVDQKGQLPDFISEKFRNAENPMEAQAKAYAEAERRMSEVTAKKDVAFEVKRPDGQAEETGRLDMNKYAQEYAETGSISPESRAEMSKIGLDDRFVDQWVSDRQAAADATRDALFEIAGGAQRANQMLEWAGKNLDDTELNGFNAAMESGNIGQMKLAMRGLATQFGGTTVGQNNFIDGQTGGPAVQPFETIEDMVLAQGSDEYASSPSKRAEIDKRIAATPLWDSALGS